jgi:hypothetical protein
MGESHADCNAGLDAGFAGIENQPEFTYHVQKLRLRAFAGLHFFLIRKIFTLLLRTVAGYAVIGSIDGPPAEFHRRDSDAELWAKIDLVQRRLAWTRTFSSSEPAPRD